MIRINFVKAAVFTIAIASSILAMAFNPFDTPHHMTGDPKLCQAASLPGGCILVGSFSCRGASGETVYQKNDCTVEFKRISP